MSTFNHDMATLLIMTDFECISWKMTWIEVVRRIYFTVAHWHPFYIDFMFWSLIPDFTILFCIKTYFVLIFFFFYKLNIGDDCISIVGNSSIIRIKNIACGPGHGIRYKIDFGFCCLEPWVSWRPLLNWSILISVGSLGMGNSWAQVHDVIVDQAFLAHTKNGLRIKTWQVINHLHWLLFLIMNLYVGMICVFLNLPFVLVYQGGRGFASQITFQNVLMENVSHPIIIDQYYCDSLTPCLNQVCSLLLTLTL